MGGAIAAAIPALMSAVGGGAAAGAGGLASLMSAPAGAEGIASAMPKAGELFGSLGQAMPSADSVASGGPGFGMGANGGPDIKTSEFFGNGEAIAKGLVDGGDYMQKNPETPMLPDEYPGQGAMAHYKDMSQYGSMSAISGLMNSQPPSKQNRMIKEPRQVNEYLQSLMGG